MSDEPERLIINFDRIESLDALLKVLAQRGDDDSKAKAEKLIEYILKDTADKEKQGAVKAALAAYKQRIREDEYVFILERDDEGDPLYLHHWDCSNYCDYACNGDSGFEMAKGIKEKA